MSTATKVRPAINRKRLESLLRQVVAGREDYTDPNVGKSNGCKYFHRDGRPSCIVGNLLVAAGVDVPFTPRSKYNKVTVDELATTFPELFTEAAASVLYDVQDLQDSGVTWGEAVRPALSHKRND